MGPGRDGDERRRTERQVPLHRVRVEAEAETVGPLEGEARDLSRGGACVALASELAVGDEVILRLLFERYPNPIPATGRIVWRGRDQRQEGRCGVEWTHTGPHRVWLDWLART
jgi:hypothetical protein